MPEILVQADVEIHQLISDNKMHITRVTFCGVLAVFALWTGGQEPANIRTDVNLVQLHARVTDSGGRTVSGLEKDTFQLFVDDAPQTITVFQAEDAPVTAGIVVDNSASMSPKRDEVLAAALAFARASNRKDQMFVVHFNDRARFGLPAGILCTGNVSELETAIAAFDPGGTTAFYDALLLAESRLRLAAYWRKVLLTITDGGDNSSHATLTEALNGAVNAGVVVYSIGIFDENDRDRNPTVLSRIAEQTGGSAFFPKELSDVTRICVHIAEDIRHQYTLGFRGADDGQYHRIRVTVKDAKYGSLQVQTRGGYFAGKPSQYGNQNRYGNQR